MSLIARIARTAAPAMAAFALLAAPALAQPLAPEESPAVPPSDGRLRGAERAAEDILTQPVRDVGLMGPAIPDALARAIRDPYDLPASSSCAQIDGEIDALNGSLGPERGDGAPSGKESRVARLAEAGGRAAVNSIIPFRTLVREVSGAAPAQRRLEEAVQFGYARRGFLRGVYLMRACPSGLNGRG